MTTLCAWVFLFLAAAAAGPDRDFTGSWKLNPDRSEIHSLPERPARLLRIDQDGSWVDVRSFGSEGEPSEVVRFTTDGAETKSKVRSGTRSSMSKWEGTALLINTIVNAGPANYTEMDRWKLSHDGRTLTIRREIVKQNGETESTLVYNRQ